MPNATDLEFARLYTEEGLTLEEIGILHGVTRERVRQRLVRVGVTGKDGGFHNKMLSRSAAREKAKHDVRDRKTRRVWGCTYSELSDIRATLVQGDLVSLERVYRKKRMHAFREHVPWYITFPQFVELMRDHIDGYGRHLANKVIFRKDKMKPYTLGNVEVMTLQRSSSLTMTETQAARLRAEGKTLREVAERLGVSKAGASLALQRARAKESFRLMSEVVLTIDTPRFNAGVVIHGRKVIDAAPILRYMIGWSVARVRIYCQKKGWSLQNGYKECARPRVCAALRVHGLRFVDRA